MFNKLKKLIIPLFSIINLITLKVSANIVCEANAKSQSDSDKYICLTETATKNLKLSYLDKDIYDALTKKNKIIIRFSTEGSETGSKTINGIP